MEITEEIIGFLGNYFYRSCQGEEEIHSDNTFPATAVMIWIFAQKGVYMEKTHGLIRVRYRILKQVLYILEESLNEL